MSGLDENIELDQNPAENIGSDEDLKGFVTKEEWVSQGKDPNDWRDPVEFKHKGELIRQKKELERFFDSRLKEELKNTNMLWETRLKQEREELLQLRDQAIEIADKTEVKKLDLKIEANQKQAELVASQNAAVMNQKPKEIAEWEADNPWIFNSNDSRVKIANDILDAELAQGKTIASALRAVDREMAKLEPQKKTSSQLVEGSRTASGRKESPGLSWEDLTPQEVRVFEAGLFKGDKQKFLKSVQNSRVK